MTDVSCVLMVMFEPAAGAEGEFHAWSDSELVPDHLGVEGIRQGSRWYCLDGWPRYMGMYEVDNLDVLAGEGYKSISGSRFSAWSRWMLSQVFGRERLVLDQVGGSAHVMQADGRGLALLRFRGHLGASAQQLVEGLNLPSPCRARIFETSASSSLTWGTGGLETVVIVDAPAAALIPAWSAAALAEGLGDHARELLGIWRYARYVESQRIPAKAAEPAGAG